MNNTKSRILSESKQLFNEKGFSEVTIRMIAQKLNMSSGNLNYHFKKREDILEALYFEMVEEFDDRVKRLGESEITLEMMYQDIFQSLKRMVDYRFFWTDMYRLLRLNEKIRAHYKKVYEHRFQGYIYLFDYLMSQGILSDFGYENERKLLIERMIGFSNTCIYNSATYDVNLDERFIENQTQHLMIILYPYLTKDGQKQYRKLLPGVFK
ncbi:TetR/AcrR family transcriptional regulator [bacterium SCSIO 12741]|nr:TetR/AcrR family transcriptional regulator [bacterium SCSIO 12741]